MRIGLPARVVASALALTGATLGAQSTGACTGINDCMEARNIVATVTDFRTSMASSTLHVVTATVHFTNKGTKPLILGYVNGSGIAIDDQGNRFSVLNASSVRAIGIINGSNVDTKFSLRPGESADARFELGWRASANKIFGTSYTLDMTVREIVPANASQFQLGDEYALRFPSLQGSSQLSSAAGPALGGTTVSPNASVQQITQTVANACAGIALCYDAGPFSAVVTSATASKSGNTHVISMNVRLRNLSSQPVILAYTQKSSAMIDNLGNRYFWGRSGSADRSVQGIGMVAGTHADPQFVLQPGDSRDAKFLLARYNVGNSEIGTSFTYDVSIEQLGILPSQQIRSLRQYAVHFDNVTTGGVAPNVTDALSKLKGLFKKK